MSFLTPLYALAALGIALPILLHLIKRQPKSQKTFSSLMFLTPSPPTLVRRSRIDQWLLLLLRALALLMLAFAFMRPFMRRLEETAAPTFGKRLLILVDTSASMRRPGIAEAVQREVRRILDATDVRDTLAVYTFDRKLQRVLSFEETASLNPSAVSGEVFSRIKEQTPSWFDTDLGTALVEASDLIQGAPTGDEKTAGHEVGHIFVVSDLHDGAKIDALESYTWPGDVSVEFRAVRSSIQGNVFASRMHSRQSDDDLLDKKVKVRVTSGQQSATSRIALRWKDTNDREIPQASRNIDSVGGSVWLETWDEMPSGAQRLTVEGDGVEFDNSLYIADSPVVQRKIVCVDLVTKQPSESLSYFLEKLAWDTKSRHVELVRRKPRDPAAWTDWPELSWVIASHALAPEDVDGLKPYVEAGGHVLWVLDHEATPGSPVQQQMQLVADKWLGAQAVVIQESQIPQYAMLEGIVFSHPWLAVFADSKFNDFTKIRYWKHRTWTSHQPTWKTLASFDNEGPAWIEQSIGQGKLWIMTAGWQPNESQLALSSKFVPLILGLFALTEPTQNRKSEYIVGETISLEPEEELVLPTGNVVAKSDTTASTAILLDQPGVYQIRKPNSQFSLAVNIDPTESRDMFLDQDRLTRLGLKTQSSLEPITTAEINRQLRASELENRQSWWRWIMVGVLAVIGIESWLATRAVRALV